MRSLKVRYQHFWQMKIFNLSASTLIQKLTHSLIFHSLVALAILGFTLPLIKSERVPVVLSQQTILANLQKHAEIAQYSNLPAEVKFLSSQELASQAKKFPVIYGDLKGSIYEVRFATGGSGTLLFYDAKSDRILKTFNLLEWKALND